MSFSKKKYWREKIYTTVLLVRVSRRRREKLYWKHYLLCWTYNYFVLFLTGILLYMLLFPTSNIFLIWCFSFCFFCFQCFWKIFVDFFADNWLYNIFKFQQVILRVKQIIFLNFTKQTCPDIEYFRYRLKHFLFILIPTQCNAKVLILK